MVYHQYIYIYIYIYVCIYIYIYINFFSVSQKRQTENVQWSHGNSCTWAHDNLKGTLSVLTILSVFDYMYYSHLTSVRFIHSVCYETLLTSFIHIYIYIYIYT